MPKSKNRKNHKKKLQSWKNTQTRDRNTAMKKFEDIKKRMMEERNKKLEGQDNKTDNPKKIEPNPSTNMFRPADTYPTKNK